MTKWAHVMDVGGGDGRELLTRGDDANIHELKACVAGLTSAAVSGARTPEGVAALLDMNRKAGDCIAHLWRCLPDWKNAIRVDEDGVLRPEGE